MKAVILAAGKGTRMKELTDEIPKPMLKVQGRPILEHILMGLVESGIREYFLVTGWRANVIEDHFCDGSRWGVRIEYGRQLIQDGTGKAPELAKSFVADGPFLLTYGDILVRPETYGQMLARYASGPFSGLLAVTEGQDVSKGAIGLFDGDFCLQRLIEKPTPAQLHSLMAEGMLRAGDPLFYNAGIYIFQPTLFEYTSQLQKSPRGEYELTDAIIEMIKSGHRIAGLRMAGRWVDVRDPAVLADVEAGRI